MFKKSNFLIKVNIKSHLKKYKSAMIYSFIFGLVMGSIPFIYKINGSLRVQKEKKIQMQNKEKICRKDNSDYKKFLSLGFPKTANEKFKICMKEQ